MDYGECARLDPLFFTLRDSCEAVPRFPQLLLGLSCLVQAKIPIAECARGDFLGLEVRKVADF